MQRTLRLTLVTAALTAMIAACGGSDQAADPSSTASVTSTTSPSVTSPGTGAPSPTSTLPGSDGATAGSGEDAKLLLYAQVLVFDSMATRDETVAFLSGDIPESEIESCMNAAGFEYIPEQSAEEQVAADPRYSMSAEEYAAKYGMGIVGWDLGVIPPLEPPRNQEAVRAMTDNERQAYNAALGHCGGMSDPERRAFSDAINVTVEQFRPLVAADPAVVAALADWRACLAAGGYEFDTPMQMRESFYARMNSNRTEPLQAIFDDEVRVAVANVPCEAAYTATRRQVISDRFAEFKALFESAVASGAAPEAQG